MSERPTISLPVTPEERDRIEENAKRRGYEDLSDYLRSLLQVDAVTHGDPEPFEDDEPTKEEILATLRRAMNDALKGNTLPLSALDELDDE